MKSIRCGRGLGDSIYLQSVVRHMLERGGLRMRVATDWPDVFRPLGSRVECMPFTRRVDIVAHYTTRKQQAGSTQFEDCCRAAGIQEPVELRLDWVTTNPDLVARLREDGRPVMVVQLPRTPMGRLDGFGKHLLPDCRALQHLVDAARATHYVVQIGAGEPLYRLTGIHLDLANQTTVAETIDTVATAAACIGYCSFLVPLAESLGKPATFVWSARGLRDGSPFIRSITPAKILHSKASRYVIDKELFG